MTDISNVMDQTVLYALMFYFHLEMSTILIITRNERIFFNETSAP